MFGIRSFPKMLNDARLTPVFEDAALKVSMIERPGARCIVIFIGVGMDHGGVDVQSEEFRKLDSDFGSLIFVFDKQRSWGNGIDFERLTQILAPHVQDRRLSTLGLSMGGFLAILATRFMAVESCVAFCPQWSVHPDIPPHERRWAGYTDLITDWRFPSLDGAFDSGCRYSTFFTGIAEELVHLVQFPKGPNIHHYVLGGDDHNVGKAMADAGILYPVLTRALNGGGPDAMPLPVMTEDGIHVFLPEG